MDVLDPSLEPSWKASLQEAIQTPSFKNLQNFLFDENKKHTIYPAPENIYKAFALTPFDKVKVVILGQDPYHDEGQAHGLAFSVLEGIKTPPSLVNIFKELESDLGLAIPASGNLTSWAQEGVLLLNTILTVQAHKAHSHRNIGWELFTDSVIRTLNEKKENLVFILWGKPAQSKKKLIDTTRHLVLEAPHPSPLSSYRGFFGSKPFSRTNTYLAEHQTDPINWKL